MSLHPKEVVEYDLDGINNIIGLRLWPKKDYPEFKDNPDPLPEMNEPGAFFDEYDRPRWSLIGGVIVENTPGSPTATELARETWRNMSDIEKVKKLMIGIESKNDPEYTDFVDMVNLL